MADDYKISDLTTIGTVGNDDLMELSAVSPSSSSGYASFKSPISKLGDKFVNGIQYAASLHTTQKTITGSINETLSNFANEYDDTSTYAVNDCVLYAGSIYKCIVAITTAESWDPTHWTQVKAVDVGQGGGSSADHITLTQAEYDALVAAGTVDPDAYYFIEDGSPSAFYEKVLYSNVDEDNWVSQADGTVLTLSDDITQFDEIRFEGAFWEDSNSTGHKLTHFASRNISRDTIVFCLNNYADSSTSPLQWQAIFDAAFTLLGQYSYSFSFKVPTSTSLLVKNKYVSGWTATKCGITKIVGIKYDVVGGSNGHSYSTDEQIVGTWVDGSTIYEKTINVSSITVNADIRVNHGISNFGSLVGLEGHMKYSSDWLPLPYFSLSGSYQIMVGNVTATNFLYRIGSGFNVNDLSDFYVTIRYTKSSS